MSRPLSLALSLALTLPLAGCEFDGVEDAFYSATESYALRAAAVSGSGHLFAAQDDGADVTVDVFDAQGRRRYRAEVDAFHDIVGMATDPVTGEVWGLGVGDGDRVALVRFDYDGDSGAGFTLDLGTEYHSVDELCDLAMAPDGTALVTARRTLVWNGRTYWHTTLFELGPGGWVIRTQFVASSTTGPTECAWISHDLDADLTWAAMPSSGRIDAYDARLNRVDRWVLNGSGAVEDIAAEGGLVAIARDRGSSHVLELYHDGARYDVVGVDGTTALAADRTGAVPAACADDGGLLWRVHPDRDRANLHAHTVCE